MNNTKKSIDRNSMLLRILLPTFVCAYRHNADINAIYDRLAEKTAGDSQKEILANCRDLFKNSTTRKKIDEMIDNFRQQNEQEPTDSQLANIIILKFGEQITGVDKRKYDMSDMYAPEMVSNIRYSSVFKESFSLTDPDGNLITIREMGILFFNSGLDDSITKYRISTPKGTFEVFSNINYSRLLPGSPYYEAFFDELLSENNIKRSNTCNYIGELVNTQGVSPQCQVGHEDISGLFSSKNFGAIPNIYPPFS